MITRFKSELGLAQTSMVSWQRRHYLVALCLLVLMAALTIIGGPVWGICFLAVCAWGIASNPHSCCWPNSRFLCPILLMAVLRLPQTALLGLIIWAVIVAFIAIKILTICPASPTTV